jgi:hypothetical protein
LSLLALAASVLAAPAPRPGTLAVAETSETSEISEVSEVSDVSLAAFVPAMDVYCNEGINSNACALRGGSCKSGVWEFYDEFCRYCHCEPSGGA